MLKIELFKILSDGKFHSGTSLGAQLQCSRSAIWKAIKLLNNEFNLTIYAVRGRGYRLNQSIELLDKEYIYNTILSELKIIIDKLDVFFVIDSTNDYLISESGLNKYKTANCQICLAETQTKGKGRRGKKWISPIAANIYCSVSWVFTNSFHALNGLSLAISVAIAELFEQLGIDDIQLKWPNDILWQGKKLSGILLELRGEASGPCTTIIGVGINFNMTNRDVDIDQPWCDLNSILKNLPSRNEFCAQLINTLISTLQLYEQQGLLGFMKSWQKFDIIQNKSILITHEKSTQPAIARGIDSNGALLIEQNGKISPLYSGEVSIRLN